MTMTSKRLREFFMMQHYAHEAAAVHPRSQKTSKRKIREGN